MGKNRDTLVPAGDQYLDTIISESKYLNWKNIIPTGKHIACASDTCSIQTARTRWTAINSLVNHKLSFCIWNTQPVFHKHFSMQSKYYFKQHH